MSVDNRKLYINGTWTDAAGNATFDVGNPSTGNVFASVADAAREDATRAIQAAQDAFPQWSAMNHAQRARILHKAGDIVEARAKEIHDVLIDEGGSWIGKGMFESGYTSGVFRAAAAAAYQVNGEILPSEHGKMSLVMRVPLGVVSVISPWNFPMVLGSRGFAPALAVGNCVVLKPSEETPVAGGIVFAEILEEAGVPPGVFNVITCSREHVGEVGDELIANPLVHGVSFTGSTAVGSKIAARAGGLLKKCCVELGGKDALLVLDDADIELAVNAATFGAFMHQGQICMSVERIIVDEKIADEFTEKLVANARKLKVGNPRELANCIGPVINATQLRKIREQIDEAIAQGAELLCGGKNDGLFIEPTVLGSVTRDMRIFREETFGPVAPIIRAANVEEAIEIANDSDYGLSSGIITRDEEKGLRVAQRLRTGMAHVNDSSVNDEPHVPFGGIGASGVGRHGGKPGIDTFTELRWITLERGGRHYPPPFLMNPGH